MRLQYLPDPCFRIVDREDNEVILAVEEAEELYIGLGFMLRDMRKVEEEKEAAE